MNVLKVAATLIALSSPVLMAWANPPEGATAQSAETAALAINAGATWSDASSTLMWAKKDNGEDIDGSQAANYCHNLKLGGYSNWRLPEIAELQGIYDERLQVCGYGDESSNCSYHVRGSLQLNSPSVWSKTAGEESGEAMYFNFGNGARYSSPLENSGGYRALCVRNPEK